MNGHKRLVRGNHDIFEDKLYYECGFDKMYGVRVWPKHNLIFSHTPLHPDCLSGRGWTNIHGHLHSNLVMESNGKIPDKRYQCVSLEHTNYKPVLIMR